jgi:hypothetical protein
MKRPIYSSSNGDRWSLVRDISGDVSVLHEPNKASGGAPTTVPLWVFLAPSNRGPEHQALRAMIDSLITANE